MSETKRVNADGSVTIDIDIPTMRVKLVLPWDATEPTPLRAADFLPTYQTARAAGLDLHYMGLVPLRLAAGHRRVFPTGVHVELPPNTMGEIRPRSGLSRRGIDVILGTVDEDYRGEIGVLLANNSGDGVNIQPGERIGQLVIVPYVRVAVAVLGDHERLSDTGRGANGWGSTGTSMRPFSCPYSDKECSENKVCDNCCHDALQRSRPRR